MMRQTIKGEYIYYKATTYLSTNPFLSTETNGVEIVISGIIDTKMNLIKDGVNLKNSSTTHLRLSLMVMDEHFSNYLNQNEEGLSFFQNFFCQSAVYYHLVIKIIEIAETKKEPPVLEIEGITFGNLFKSQMHMFCTGSTDLFNKSNGSCHISHTMKEYLYLPEWRRVQFSSCHFSSHPSSSNSLSSSNTWNRRSHSRS